MSALLVPLVTLTTSVAARVIPRVNAFIELGSIDIVFIKVLALLAAAPPCFMLIVALAAEEVILLIVKLDITADVAEGTVYKVVSFVSDGHCCPNILYTVGI